MLDGIPIVELTVRTLLGITVLLLLTGRIVPRYIYMEKAKEADRWREAYEQEKEARTTSDRQTAELLEVAKTTHNIIAAMFGTSSRIRQSRDLGRD